MKFTRFAITTVALAALPLWITACSQGEVAALVTTLGNASAAVASLEGNTALAAKLKTDTVAASAAVLAWKAGSPATEAVEAINLVEDDLNLFPVTDQYAPLITLALGTAESIIEILAPSSGPALTAHVAGAGRRTVHLAKAPKSAREFRKLWNDTATSQGLAGVQIQ